MAIYTVTITETIVKSVVIEAEDIDCAEELVMKAYDNDIIMLGPDDFVDTQIDVDIYDEELDRFYGSLTSDGKVYLPARVYKDGEDY